MALLALLIAGENDCLVVSNEISCLYMPVCRITWVITLVSFTGSVLFGAVVV